MSKLIDTLLKSRERLSKRERAELREHLKTAANMRDFSSRVSSLLNHETSSDSHVLEDIFVFGHQVHDIVRGPLPLSIDGITMPVVAFVYGYTREPLDRVFDKSAAQEIAMHLQKPDAGTPKTTQQSASRKSAAPATPAGNISEHRDIVLREGTFAHH